MDAEIARAAPGARVFPQAERLGVPRGAPLNAAAVLQLPRDGAHADPARLVLTTAKHFPGHGDTRVDSHLALPRIRGRRGVTGRQPMAKQR